MGKNARPRLAVGDVFGNDEAETEVAAADADLAAVEGPAGQVITDRGEIVDAVNAFLRRISN